MPNNTETQEARILGETRSGLGASVLLACATGDEEIAVSVEAYGVRTVMVRSDELLLAVQTLCGKETAESLTEEPR